MQLVGSLSFCKSVQPLGQASNICNNQFRNWSWWLNCHVKVKTSLTVSIICFKAIKGFMLALFFFGHPRETIILKILSFAFPIKSDRFAFEHMMLVNFWTSGERLNVTIFWYDYSCIFYFSPIFYYHPINFFLLIHYLLAYKSHTWEVIFSQKTIIMES